MTTERPAVILSAAALLTIVAGCEQAKPKPEPAPQTAEAPAKPKPTPPAKLPGLAQAGAATEMAPGVFVWDLNVGSGETVGPDTRTVRVSIEGWTQDGTQYFGSSAGPDELVLPAGGAAAFPGWSEAIDGLRVGGTRKVWAAGPEDSTQWPVENNSPIVLDVSLHAIDTNAQLANPLPGALVGDAAPQGGADGLRFYELHAGEGTGAVAGDELAVTYEAWLGDGTPMASATQEPVRITLDDHIAPGALAGLEGATKGSTRKLIIPAAIGIGFDPLGTLPPGSTVVMDVTVVEVHSASAPTTTDPTTTSAQVP
ncbi:MAG: FKBP-type peptidyl-prolyl cis-trans isomerase [Phycisphaerales bacterium]|nr:FKBP-type peptidyl-prolyl cis-trans isomerase [Phycisphaerales bacterium]